MQKLDMFRRRRLRNAANNSSRRRRDRCYAAAAGACLITLMNLALDNVGVSGAAIGLLSANIFGVELIRSRSKVAP
jgi:hypothetical protein